MDLESGGIMLIYQATKKDFLEAVSFDTLSDQIDEEIRLKMHRRTGKSELDSWRNSMQYMFHVLNSPAIPDDSGVAIEYNIPRTGKRVDFMISGYDSSQKPSVVIIELKQWSEVKEVKHLDAIVETYTGKGLRQVVHPSYQVWSYASLIEDFNSSVQDNSIELVPCAYLHNYRSHEDDPLLAKQYQEYIRRAPVYLKGQGINLRTMIQTHISKGDCKEVLYSIDHGQIRPSKSLQNAISSVMKGNKDFVMIDDQKVVYEEILRKAIKAKKTGRKHVIIVKGGPGTGKSVIAVNLLASLIKDGDQLAQYATRNSAPRTVYEKKLTNRNDKTITKKRFSALFSNTGSYIESKKNSVDTILCDEAHRLTEKSGVFNNLGENQVKEIIHTARCSVFFIDENQRVTFRDIGSAKEIHRFAKEENVEEVSVLELTSQFRCNGSDGFLAWIDNTLQIRDTANFSMKDMNYDIQILDSPQEVFEKIKIKNSENGNSRMVAGYCWNWDKSERNNPDHHDIKIGDFEMSWNLGNYTFALDTGSVDQAGCIHTTQGLEFDYVGVIIGEDLICRNGKILTDPFKRAKTDQSLTGFKKMLKEKPEEALKRAEEVIKNTYRTLMTRGMKGCYIYCCDTELGLYLKRALE